MLTRQAIDQAVKDGLIIIEPYNKSQLQPNSYDVRLGKTMFVIKSFALDFKKQYKYKEVTIPESGMWLWPWGLYLGVTEELTFSPHHVPVYEGRSTTGRYFLCSHQTAGFGDVGYNGHWTLEITVKRPTKVYPGMRIGQIGFAEPSGPIEGYTGNYSNGNPHVRPITGKANNI